MTVPSVEGLVLPQRCARPCDAAGFTLVELCIVLALAGVLAAVAIPSYQSRMEQARRADAQAALMRVQAAQEQFRSHHGLYAPELPNLGPAGRALSEAGYYALALERTAGETYRATATAQANGPQARDAACRTLTLEVQRGFAQHGPSARCWGR